MALADQVLMNLNTLNFHVIDTAFETDLLLNVAQILIFHLGIVETIYLVWHFCVMRVPSIMPRFVTF